MLVIRTPQAQIDAYFESPDLNQSLIKEAEKGVLAFKNAQIKLKALKNERYYNEPSEGFLIGSGVDCIVTQGQEVFDLNYYVASEGIAKPSDAIMSIVKAVFDAVIAEDTGEESLQGLSIHREKILLSVAAHNWNTRWTDDVKFNKVFTEGTPYWKLLTESRGKTILTLDEYTTIKEIAEKIINSYPYNRAIEYEDIVLFQLPIYFDSAGVNCKALIDMVTINLSRKTIKIYDFKTMSGSVLKFKDSLRKFRYDIQGAWYREAILEKFQNGPDILDYLTSVVDSASLRPFSRSSFNFAFKIESVNFIVASTTNNSPVINFRMSKDLLTLGKIGRNKTYYSAFSTEDAKVIVHATTPIVGFKELLDLAVRYHVGGLTTDSLPNTHFLLDWDEIRADNYEANES